MKCALRVFARRGIGAARHAEIAAEAGVAVPTVFAYFPNREALVREVLREVDWYLADMVWSAVGAGETVFEKLLSVVRAFAERVESDPDTMKIWLDWSTAMRDEVWPLYEDLQRRVIVHFVDLIRAGQEQGEVDPAVNPEVAAYMVVGGGHMIAQMKFTGRAPADVEEYLETLVLGALHPRSG
jgi:TetR/AcrR family hemagglutinin/protease transcriptional regulator